MGKTQYNIVTNDVTYHCNSYRTGLVWVRAVGVQGTKLKIRKSTIKAIGVVNG